MCIYKMPKGEHYLQNYRARNNTIAAFSHPFAFPRPFSMP